MKAEFLPIVNKAKKDKDVLAVAVFGSYVRQEKHRDIDICLILQEKRTDADQRREASKRTGVKTRNNLEMSKKKLEYMKIAGNRIDIQVFQQLPLYIRHRVLKEGKIIFCKNKGKLYDVAIGFIKEYEDFKPIYNSYLEAVKTDRRLWRQLVR